MIHSASFLFSSGNEAPSSTGIFGSPECSALVSGMAACTLFCALVFCGRFDCDTESSDTRDRDEKAKSS